MGQHEKIGCQWRIQKGRIKEGVFKEDIFCLADLAEEVAEEGAEKTTGVFRFQGLSTNRCKSQEQLLRNGNLFKFHVSWFLRKLNIDEFGILVKGNEYNYQPIHKTKYCRIFRSLFCILV